MNLSELVKRYIVIETDWLEVRLLALLQNINDVDNEVENNFVVASVHCYVSMAISMNCINYSYCLYCNYYSY